MATQHTHQVCSIIPPFILSRVAAEGAADERAAALRTLTLSTSIRAHRSLIASLVSTGRATSMELAPAAPPPEQEVVYDVAGGSEADLPGARKRALGDPAVADPAVNEAYDGADATYHFYLEVFARASVDGRGLPLVSSVHFGHGYDNAFWNGSQMVYGDGSGQVLAVGSLTKALDVIGHELTHGVTQYTAGLEYHVQPGALNESISDVFGSLVRQRHLGQTAEQADWLIGPGILGTALHGVALRSMKDPGTAFSGDPQPATMASYVHLPDNADPANDNGGVHINSGIPNKAFYLTAMAIGGNAWEAPGRIWYDALTTRLTATANFAAAARATVASAAALFGRRSSEAKAVREAWREVGVLRRRS
jgi:Zn-dependent metalloprotease